MTEARFKIVFEGEVLPDVSLDTAKDNLARLFKSERAKVEGLFSGASVVLKRDLPDSQAEKYLSALHNAGIRAHKQAELSLAPGPLSFDKVDSPSASASMTCPKCGHEQPKAVECVACGVVIEKFLARQAQLVKEPASDTAGAAPSPYSPPQSQVGEVLPEFGELNVFGVQGRIGRLRYLAWSMAMLLIAMPVLGLLMAIMTLSDMFGGLLVGVAAIALTIISIFIGVQRLHDIGWSGWLWLLNLIPGIGSIFALVMLFAPGSEGANRFGAPPPPNSRAVKVLAWSMILVPIIGILAAIALPAYQGYVERANQARYSESADHGYDQAAEVAPAGEAQAPDYSEE